MQRSETVDALAALLGGLLEYAAELVRSRQARLRASIHYQYRIVVLGAIPPGIVEKMSALHAEAILSRAGHVA